MPHMRIISGPGASVALAHPDVDTVPYADRYAILADRLKVDFRSILFTLNHVPLCLGGEQHVAQRSEVARLIAEGRDRLTAALPGIVAQAFGPLDVPGSHDVMAETVIPCIDATLRCLVGADLGLHADSLISRIFSQAMGVAKRRRLEVELNDLVARMQDAFPGEDDQRTGSRVALAVLGRDALTGSLGTSLHDFFVRAGDQPLSAVTFGKVPLRTGVPYIDRVAQRDADIAGHSVVAGQVLRCDLKSLEGLPDSERLRFFGRGVHVCLGRSLSLELFGEISNHLSRVSRRITVTDFELRDDDVFALPKTFVIRVQ